MPDLEWLSSSDEGLLTAWISPCAASQILSETKDDTPQPASFDWQQVFFEMYWAQGPVPTA